MITIISCLVGQQLCYNRGCIENVYISLAMLFVTMKLCKLRNILKGLSRMVTLKELFSLVTNYLQDITLLGLDQSQRSVLVHISAGDGEVGSGLRSRVQSQSPVYT